MDTPINTAAPVPVYDTSSPPFTVDDLAPPPVLNIKRFCGECGQHKPITAFDSKGGGKRRSVCRACSREIAKGLREPPRVKKAVQALKTELAKAAKESPEVPTGAAVISGVIERLGSVSGYLDMYAQNIMAAKPGSRTKLAELRYIADKSAEIAEKNSPLTAIAQMSDEDLSGALMEMLRQEAANRGLKVVLVADDESEEDDHDTGETLTLEAMAEMVDEVMPAIEFPGDASELNDDLESATNSEVSGD